MPASPLVGKEDVTEVIAAAMFILGLNVWIFKPPASCNTIFTVFKKKLLKWSYYVQINIFLF